MEAYLGAHQASGVSLTATPACRQRGLRRGKRPSPGGPPQPRPSWRAVETRLAGDACPRCRRNTSPRPFNLSAPPGGFKATRRCFASELGRRQSGRTSETTRHSRCQENEAARGRFVFRSIDRRCRWRRLRTDGNATMGRNQEAPATWPRIQRATRGAMAPVERTA
ncbi:hypothetical protein MTO96_001436 [Rhipicephalus appendiculatus]